MFALLGVAFGAMGCGEGSADNARSDKTVAPQTLATKLAALDTDTKHIEVFEDLPGEIVVSEEGPIGTDSVLDGWIGHSTLTEMYKTLAPKLKKPLSADVLRSFADADARAESLRTLRAAQPLQEVATPETPAFAQGPSGPNYYDFNGDSSWWRGNYCRPGGWCTVWNTWSHSGGMTNIANWHCNVMNASDFGTATLTMRALTCSGLFCSDSWQVMHTDTLNPRWIKSWWASNSNTVGRSCEGDGVNGTLVNVGFYWDTPAPPAPPPPPATCGPYIYRAQTNGCTNGTNGSASSLKICADGCGSTPAQAQANAAASLSTRVCIGSAWGCCNVTYDQNFNWCGY